MKLDITTKGCHLTEKQTQFIDRQVQKMAKLLPHMAEDLPTLHLKIHQNNTRHFNEISLTLSLPKKPIVIKKQDRTIDLSLGLAFDELAEAIKKFKSTRFANHPSIDHQPPAKRQWSPIE